MKIKTALSKVLSIALVLALSFSFATSSVFATEAQTVTDSKNQPAGVTMQPIEETQFTKEDATKSLNLTVDELNNCNVYVVNIPMQDNTTPQSITSDSASINSDVSINPLEYQIPADFTWNWSPFTFTSYNGGSWWQLMQIKSYGALQFIKLKVLLLVLMMQD